MLAKVAGAKRKRDRDDDDGADGMDVDDGQGEGSDGEGEEGDWMDVDDEAGAPTKRAKANSGAVVAKGRQPRSNRYVAGMRDEAVSDSLLCSWTCADDSLPPPFR